MTTTSMMVRCARYVQLVRLLGFFGVFVLYPVAPSSRDGGASRPRVPCGRAIAAYPYLLIMIAFLVAFPLGWW